MSTTTLGKASRISPTEGWQDPPEPVQPSPRVYQRTGKPEKHSPMKRSEQDTKYCLDCGIPHFHKGAYCGGCSPKHIKKPTSPWKHLREGLDKDE
jgi:hypothetical protein